MENRIILALDNIDTYDAIQIMKKTTGLVWGYKIRKAVLNHGLSVVSTVKEYGNCMVDFKHYDIPMAMDECVRREIDAGADITTVHMSADWKPSFDICQNIAGVTILTSMKTNSYKKYYQDSIGNTVKKMSEEAMRKNYGYIVCSALDLDHIKDDKKTTICKIIPGIRPEWSIVDRDDQDRIVTPNEAIKKGAHYLVMGRPIIQATNMIDALKRTNDEISEALQ